MTKLLIINKIKSLYLFLSKNFIYIPFFIAILVLFDNSFLFANELNESKSNIELINPDISGFISSKIDKSSTKFKDGVTRLMIASQENDIEGVNFLLNSNRGLINQQNLGGATALHIATRQQHHDIVVALLKNNANVNLFDKEGWTPLMRAAVSGNFKIFSLLFLKDAKIYFLNKNKESALLYATQSNCVLCVRMMLESEKKDLLLRNITNNELNQIQEIVFRYRNRRLQSIINNAINYKKSLEDEGNIGLTIVEPFTKPVKKNNITKIDRELTSFKFRSGD